MNSPLLRQPDANSAAGHCSTSPVRVLETGQAPHSGGDLSQPHGTYQGRLPSPGAPRAACEQVGFQSASAACRQNIRLPALCDHLYSSSAELRQSTAFVVRCLRKVLQA